MRVLVAVILIFTVLYVGQAFCEMHGIFVLRSTSIGAKVAPKPVQHHGGAAYF